MTSPSTPTLAGSHSRGLAYKQGVISAVDGNIAYVRTTLTETIPIRRDILRAKGRLPEVGETWMITREFDQWTFGLILVGGSSSNSVPQADVVGLVDDLGSINDVITTLDSRLDEKDDQIEYLTRFVYGWAPLQELLSFDNVLESMPLLSAVHSVAVAGAGRYINLGAVPVDLPIAGVRFFVSASAASSSIQLGLYRGPIDNMTQIDSVSVSTTSTGMKSASWPTSHNTVPGQNIAIGMATTAPSTLAVGGFESAIIANAPKAHLAALSATTLLSTLVMGPTTSLSSTQGRHWIGLW
jgi:hypothetical protein